MPKNSKFPKSLDKSHPKVFDIKNYNINSFEICNGHNCQGIGVGASEKNYTRVKIMRKNETQTCQHCLGRFV